MALHVIVPRIRSIPCAINNFSIPHRKRECEAVRHFIVHMKKRIVSPMKRPRPKTRVVKKLLYAKARVYIVHACVTHRDSLGNRSEESVILLPCRDIVIFLGCMVLWRRLSQ